MAQPHVEFVLAAYEWGNRERRLPRDWWHAEGEYVNSREDPDHGTHRGIEAIEGLHASWIEAYPDLQIQPVEARGNGEQVFVWVRFSGHGAESGLQLEMELAHLITMQDGRVKRLEEYLDRSEALEAVGLTD